MAKDNSPKAMDGSGMKGGNMLSGMTRKNPPGMDGSGFKTGARVNQEPTRSAPGKQPPVLGPREA